MSTHLVPYTLVDPLLSRAVASGWPIPAVGEPNADGMTPLTFTPDLTTAQTATLSDAVVALQWALPLATYQARKADYGLVASLLPVAAPTATQMRDWLRALSNILDVLLKERG